MTLRDTLLLFLLAALFASAFMFVRIAAPVFGPALLIDVRVLLAAGLLLVWGGVTRQPLALRGRLRDWLLLGALNVAIPYTLIAWAELHVTSSLAAIAMATLPLFTALVALVWTREPVTRQQASGLLLGMFGVGLVGGWHSLAASPQLWLALLALLGSALSYAVGAVYAAERFRSTPPLSLTIGTLLVAGVLLLPLAAATPPTELPGTGPLLALAALVVIPTAVAFTLDFHLLQRLGPTRLSLVAYLIAPFGALFGTLFLAEPLSLDMLAGFMVTVAGVIMANGVGLPFVKLRHRARSGAI